MKTLRLVFLLCCYLSVSQATSSQAQWSVLVEDKDENGNQFFFEHIDCSDANTCTAIGYGLTTESRYRNYVWRTTNGGATWAHQELPAHPQSLWPIARLRKVHAFDAMNVMIVGDSGMIFRTSDGGLSWVQQDEKQQWSYYDGRLVAPNKGYIVGNYGKLMMTSDGENWKSIQSPTPYVMQLVRPLGPERVLVFDRFYGMQFSSSDAGATWDTLQLFPDYFSGDTGKFIYDAYFWDENNGLLAGGNHVKSLKARNLFVMKTSDGGKSWTSEFDKEIAIGGYANTVDFFDGNHGVVGTGTASIARTSDGGKNWHRDSAAFERGMTQFTGTQMLSPDKILATAASIQSGYIVKFTPTASVKRLHSKQEAPILLLNGNKLSGSHEGVVRVIDMLGRAVATLEVEPRFSLDLELWLPTPGAYIIAFRSRDGSTNDHLKIVR